SYSHKTVFGVAWTRAKRVVAARPGEEASAGAGARWTARRAAQVTASVGRGGCRGGTRTHPEHASAGLRVPRVRGRSGAGRSLGALRAGGRPRLCLCRSSRLVASAAAVRDDEVEVTARGPRGHVERSQDAVVV